MCVTASLVIKRNGLEELALMGWTGQALVIETTARSGGYILGFRLDPAEKSVHD